MTSAQTISIHAWNLMGQAEPPLPVVFGENGSGPMALPQAHGGAAAAVRSGFDRGGKAAVSAGARVFPHAGHVVHVEEF